MHHIGKRITLYFCTLLFVLLTGCSSSSSLSSNSSGSESAESEVKNTAKSAWGAASFAMNIANPTYYAKKAGKFVYDEFEENKDL